MILVVEMYHRIMNPVTPHNLMNTGGLPGNIQSHAHSSGISGWVVVAISLLIIFLVLALIEYKGGEDMDSEY